MQTNKADNIEWINSLRLIALYAVIVLHATAPLLEEHGKVSAFNWWTADVFNALVRFAVPVLVMITGALLLHKDYEVVEFLKKRLGRVVIPFLFWSLIYVWYSWYNEELVFTKDAWGDIKMVLHLLKYGSSYHLWYVYMLIGLYFFIPVLSKFVRHATEKEILYFLFVWFAAMLLAQPYLSMFNPAVDMHYFAGFAGYLVLGHYLAFKDFGIKQPLLWGALSLVLSAGTIAIGTWAILPHGNLPGTMFYEPVSPAVVLLSAGVFIMAKYSVKTNLQGLNRIEAFTGRYTYGMYLAHALVLYFLDDPFGISYKLWSPLVSIPLTALICFILSFALVWMISKIPFAKYVAG